MMASTALHAAGARLACRSFWSADTFLCAVTTSQHHGPLKARTCCFGALVFLACISCADADSFRALVPTSVSRPLPACCYSFT